MMYFSSAHAPRSICLQRSLQNGRYLLDSVHSTFLPQVGQSTMATMRLSCEGQESEIAERELERNVALERLGLHVAALAGEAYPQHILVGRDLGDRAQCRINRDA